MPQPRAGLGSPILSFDNRLGKCRRGGSTFPEGTHSMTSRKLALVLLFILLGASLMRLGAGGASPTLAAPQEASPAAPKTAEQQFKNIQVFKGLPAQQLLPAMSFMAAGLGVRCQYCHVPEEFEKDEKPAKQTARRMIQMTFAINKENFEGKREVNCYTCHRGQTKP